MRLYRASFVCARCEGTPFDPAYLDNETEPITEDVFAELVEQGREVEKWR